MSAKKRKIRTELRKNRSGRTRDTNLTRRFHTERIDEDQSLGERISGKGELTRKRTVVGQDSSAEAGGFDVQRDVDLAACQEGRVLAVYGLTSEVLAADGQVFNCATRRLLKTLSTDQRHVVAAGDVVWFRPAANREGLIERVEPRTSVISRTSRGRQHILVANVDQMLIVGSAAQPYLKPNLIDRFLVTAEKNRIRPLIVINKIDLVEPATLAPLAGVYAAMGYDVHLVSAVTGQGIARLRRRVLGRASVVTGQSGVGKSSLLNAIEPELGLRVREVSEENEKGRHTTTTARFIPLTAASSADGTGGYVVDTPGIRQFQLWDVIPEEVIGFYRDLRPYVFLCRFPNCTHTHETDCAIKNAVADGQLDTRRYDSYCALRAGEME